jgi:hypothetical protein
MHDLLHRKRLALPSPISPLIQNFRHLTITVLVQQGIELCNANTDWILARFQRAVVPLSG